MPDTYISVDIEASGPVPGEYSMLSLGACVVGATDRLIDQRPDPSVGGVLDQAMPGGPVRV